MQEMSSSNLRQDEKNTNELLDLVNSGKDKNRKVDPSKLSEALRKNILRRKQAKQNQ